MSNESRLAAADKSIAEDTALYNQGFDQGARLEREAILLIIEDVRIHTGGRVMLDQIEERIRQRGEK